MANVEVQLDVKAEYKQALTAIAMLSKALDAVQQRAKVALSVSGGAQGGADGAGKAETEQKAAVEALSAAMKDAAAAAAMLTESVGKLTPALEAMGPQAAQVQQVLTLAEHYKQLAAAMDIAADAAAKYNASGAQQGEIDARIRKLMEENQRLMDLIVSIREEYAAVVRRNAELNRTRKEREENNKAVKEEMEVTQDLTYQMELAAMSKRELVAEIDRLIKARKEAAKAGDESKYKELTEELKLARQAMTKLRQEQQLARIVWMQQAQTAQQLGANIRTVTEGVMNFGDAVENGTVNLNGMVSAVESTSRAIKAGLGPFGWALLAVEALTVAWNSYVKSQKEAEEAEKKRQEKIVNITAAYHEAALEAKKFKDQEARNAELNELLARHEEINVKLRERNALQEKNLRMIQVELAMQAKEEEQELSIERNDILRAFYRGEIDEEERDSRLDNLKIKQARNKKAQTLQLGKAKIDAAKNKISEAYSAREAAGYGWGALQADADLYKLSPAEMEERVSAYIMNESMLREQERRIAETQQRIKELEAYRNLLKEKGYENSTEYAFYDEKLDDTKRQLSVLLSVNEGLISTTQKSKEALNGWSVEAADEYAERHRDFQKKYKAAQERVQKAEADILAAEEQLADIKEQQAMDLRRDEQAITHAIQTSGQNAMLRSDKRDYQKRQAEAKAAAAAKKEAEKLAKQQSEIIGAAEWQINSANRDGLTGMAAADVKWLLEKGMKDAQDGALSAKNLERLLRAWDNAQTSKTSADNDLIKLVASMVKKLNGASRDQRRRLEALQKNQI